MNGNFKNYNFCRLSSERKQNQWDDWQTLTTYRFQPVSTHHRASILYHYCTVSGDASYQQKKNLQHLTPAKPPETLRPKPSLFKILNDAENMKLDDSLLRYRIATGHHRHDVCALHGEGNDLGENSMSLSNFPRKFWGDV